MFVCVYIYIYMYTNACSSGFIGFMGPIGYIGLSVFRPSHPYKSLLVHYPKRTKC